jgi:formamidopyrimidine-DNA glycosylase
MPELPDLEVVKDLLTERLVGVGIERAEVGQPLTIRHPISAFTATLQDNAFTQVQRRGQLLLFHLGSGHVLVVNLMLAGRFQYCLPSQRRRAATAFILHLTNGWQLRYTDPRQMGKVYLVPDDALDTVSGFAAMGPEADDPELTLAVFRERLRHHRGQIKNILVNEAFVAGIGNAYADEVLFAARVHPYRQRTSLTQSEVEALYHTMRQVLSHATATIRQRLGEDISVEVRDFLQVHGKGGLACPRCDSTISEIRANQRLTNFCRRCQA